MYKNISILLMAILAFSGCINQKAYNDTGIGKFEGVLEVRWLEPNRFLFVPNENDPLRFITPDGERIIQPEPMYTDGGSIPRLFWSVPGYSPWGIGPAYLIHDWLFVAHHCKNPNYIDIEFDDSARLLGECIKTLMEAEVVPKNEALFYNIVTAVNTPIAEGLWKKGECDLPPQQLAYGTVGEYRVIMENRIKNYQLEFRSIQNRVKIITKSREKESLQEKMVGLEDKLKASRRILDANKMRSKDKEATILLFKIDMKEFNK